MKKYLAMLCATMLCVCCLGLAACSGSSSPSAASSGASSESASSESASASASASSSSAAVDFAGEWKFAGAQMDLGSGAVTMVGDLSSLLGDSMNFALTLNDDGTGSFNVGEEATAIVWTANGDTGITLTAADESASSEAAEASSEAAEASSEAAAAAEGEESAAGALGEPLDFTYENGVLSAKMEQEGQSIVIMFSKDGTIPDALVIDAANAKPITDQAALVGSWNLTGMKMVGLSIYGDSSVIGSMSGSADLAVTFNADGTAVFGGQDMTFTAGADGAAIGADGVSVPVMALGDDILLDLTESAGVEMILVYGK